MSSFFLISEVDTAGIQVFKWPGSGQVRTLDGPQLHPWTRRYGLWRTATVPMGEGDDSDGDATISESSDDGGGVDGVFDVFQDNGSDEDELN